MTVHTPALHTRSARSPRSTGWVPFALVAVVVVPAIAGSLRLVELAGGPSVMPVNPRMSASPLPVVVHIICAVPYAVLGAFQFSSGFRRRRPGWHRASGRVVVGLGLAVAFSALWMTQFYPRQPGTGELTTDLSLGAGWAINLAVAEYVIRRTINHRTIGHRAIDRRTIGHRTIGHRAIDRRTISRRTTKATTKVGSP